MDRRRTSRNHCEPFIAAIVVVFVFSIAFAAGVDQVALPPPGASAAQPATAADAASLSRRAAARIQALQREADQLASRERGLLEELRRLEIDRDLNTAQFDAATRSLETITAQLEETRHRLDALDRSERAQRPGLANRLVELYKLGNAGYLRLLLSVDDLRGLGRAYRVVSSLEQLDRQRVLDHDRTVKALRATRATLESRQADQAKALDAARAARAAATQAAAAHAALVDQIDARRDLNARLVGELEAAQARLQQALAALAGGDTRAAERIALPLAPFRGDLDWPAAGRLTTRFGPHRSVRFSTSVVSTGVEIAAAPDSPVTAVHEGVVAYAAPFTGFGDLVIVDHGAQAYSLYGDLATIDVAKGARVRRGDRVGTVGTNLSGNPSLYFELRVDGKPVDPVQWLKHR